MVNEMETVGPCKRDDAEQNGLALENDMKTGAIEEP